MSDLDNSSSSFNLKGEDTSNSFAESDDKSIKSPVQNSDDSEVERSDNESVNEDKSESNEQVIDEHEDNSNSSSVHSNQQHKIEQISKDNEDDEDNENVDNDENKEEDDENNENVDNDANKEDIDVNKEENDENKGDDDENKGDDDELSSKAKNDVDSDSEEDDELRTKLKKKKKETDEIFGDSDSENDEPSSTINKRKLGNSSNEDSEEEFFAKKKKSTAIIKDSDEESDNQSDSDEEQKEKKKKILSDEDEANEQDEEQKDEQENNQTSSQNEDKQLPDDDKVLPDISSSSSSEDELEDDRSKRSAGSDLMYDFDIMMAKRKEQNARNRKRRNVDLINDSDDFIADLLNQMKQAAEDDFELNKNRKAATRKMKLLPTVQIYLRKIDLRESFLDSGVLSVITDWLTPLPDRSLPNLQVRETMLKILLELNIMDVDRLKSSSIGKAVMYLFKHPKETKENKRRAAQLISNWSRPIFNCETDYQSISKEEREQRDYDLMTKVQKRKGEESTASNSHSMETQATLRPGDKGWVPRARVPAPSTKDYVVRPKSTVEIEFGRSASKKPVSRLDKHLRSFQEKKRSSKMQRAVKMSIEGRKL